MTNTDYTNCKSGNTLLNQKVGEQFIYEKLSDTHWTLIVCGKEKIKFKFAQLKICHVPEKTYPFRYILIQPDRKIVLANNSISENDVINCLG